jgi:hypothetical protein
MQNLNYTKARFGISPRAFLKLPALLQPLALVPPKTRDARGTHQLNILSSGTRKEDSDTINEILIGFKPELQHSLEDSFLKGFWRTEGSQRSFPISLLTTDNGA